MKLLRIFAVAVGLAAIGSILSPAIGVESVSQSTPTIDEQALVIELRAAREPSGKGRPPLHRDELEWLFVTDAWQTPAEGTELELASGESSTWRAAEIERGTIELERPVDGYALVTLQSDRQQVMMLSLTGCRSAYFNGEPHLGGYYSGTNVTVPVLVKEGQNELLLRLTRRSGLRPTFHFSVPGRDFSWGIDLLPEVIAGDSDELWCSGVLANNSLQPLTDVALQLECPDGVTATTPLGRIEPLCFRRTSFAIAPARSATSGAPTADSPGKFRYRVSGVTDGQSVEIATGEFSLRTVDLNKLTEDYARLTYRSSVDGSVQYYAFRPADPLPNPGERPALFLAMHGASVDATTHASSYYRKPWGHIVSPTNRGPYGYNWEEFGRIDALDVMAEVSRRFHTDPRRTFATGHSMGGHGTWHMGVLYPDKFAAIAPSAGYPNLLSYVRRRPDAPSRTAALQDLLDRASTSCQTEQLARNLVGTGVYILHGSADGVVRADEARKMAELLSTFHSDYQYHEEPGAGHWWTDTPSANVGRVPCSDWDEIFDLFARRITPRPDEVLRVSFVTPNPEISSRNQWLRILAQERHNLLGSVDAEFIPKYRQFKLSTDNVSRVALDVSHLPANPISVVVNGQNLGNCDGLPGHSRVYLESTDGKWRYGEQPSAKRKGPHRYGPFKHAFNHNFVMVYGTQGSAEENSWAIAKARFDAEQLWYQGNGCAIVVPDTAFHGADFADRSVILYGNADTNAAWEELLAECPVQIRRDRIKVGNKQLSGPDLCCVFIQPRPDSDVATVGVVGGTGVAGCRVTNQLVYLVPGCHYPDLLVLSTEMLRDQTKGIEVAGYFGEDWSVEAGEFAWQKDE